MLFEPIAFTIPLIDWPVRWYGIFYAVSVLGGVFLLPYFLKNYGVKISRERAWDIVFVIFLAGVAGGRLGFFLFYHPAELFTAQFWHIWEGGMSFHGGLLGAAGGAMFWAQRWKIPLWRLADAAVVPLALALALGRFGNFINGELVGTPTDLRVGMIFPGWEEARHPVQLYAIFKNLVVAGILFVFTKKARNWPAGTLFALWLLLYGIFRFLLEFVREPDWVYLGLSGGQWLCLAMILGAKVLVIGLVLRTKR